MKNLINTKSKFNLSFFYGLFALFIVNFALALASLVLVMQLMLEQKTPTTVVNINDKIYDYHHNNGFNYDIKAYTSKENFSSQKVFTINTQKNRTELQVLFAKNDIYQHLAQRFGIDNTLAKNLRKIRFLHDFEILITTDAEKLNNTNKNAILLKVSGNSANLSVSLVNDNNKENGVIVSPFVIVGDHSKKDSESKLLKFDGRSDPKRANFKIFLFRQNGAVSFNNFELALLVDPITLEMKIVRRVLKDQTSVDWIITKKNASLFKNYETGVSWQVSLR